MESAAAVHESLWIATTEDQGFAALEGPLDVDAAVVGAGIAGLTTALLLKNAGLRVVVLEMGGICRGTTGHTTAKVTSQHGLIYDTLSSKFGEDGARGYGEANQTALDLIASLVTDHQIDCDFDRRPSYVYTEQDSQVSQLEQEAQAAQAAGLPAHYTDQTDLPCR